MVIAAAASCAVAGLLMAACGGAVAPAPAPAAAPAERPADASSRVTLYRDGALVETEMRATLVAGDSEIELPAGRWMAAPRITIAGAAGERAAITLVAPTGARQARTLAGNLAGRPVRVRSRGRVVEGELIAADPAGVAVRTAAGETVVLAADAVLELDPAAFAAATGRRSLRVHAERAGTYRLQIAYVTPDVHWRSGYGLVIERGAAAAALQGWLVIEDAGNAGLAGADLRVVDAFISSRAGPEAAEVTPPPIPLPARLTIQPDGRGHLALVGEPGRRIPAEVRMVYDPAGDSLDKATRRPVSRRNYGADLEGPVSFTVELDLAAIGIDPTTLPPGPVRVYQRDGDGVLMPVGHGTLGDAAAARPAPQTQPSASVPEPAAEAEAEDGDAAPEAGSSTRSGTVTVAMGRSPLVRATREQTDFSHDPEHKRLVEEIRVTLDNRGDQPVEVDVIEHLYRGMNWTMAYYNRLGAVEKLGPQKVRFRIQVPGREQVQLVYRAVYTW